jgi:hypothetical protein
MPIPFTVTDCVLMCWGLSLRFSQEAQMQEVGKEYFTKLNEKLNSILNIDNSFLTELYMILMRTTRNMGLIGLAHLRHLEKEARDYRELEDLLTSLGDLSFSKESIPLKLVSFFGFGSGLSNLYDLNPFKETISNLKSAGDLINETAGALDPKQINELTQKVLEFNQLNFSVESILFYILFGSIGIFIGSIAFKVFTYFYLRYKEGKITESQRKYWEKNYLDDMTKTLYILCVDIKKLLRRYYGYHENVGINIDDPMMNLTKNQAKAFIKENILPNVQIDWDIWLPPKDSTSTDSKD